MPCSSSSRCVIFTKLKAKCKFHSAGVLFDLVPIKTFPNKHWILSKVDASLAVIVK
jgi:hypothetical protein